MGLDFFLERITNAETANVSEALGRGRHGKSREKPKGSSASSRLVLVPLARFEKDFECYLRAG
jgi:hypothetical protein